MPISFKDKKPEIACGAICLSATLALAYTLIHRHFYVNSNYATLQAYIVPLASQVDGEVQEVFVSENQTVSAGQLLCRIDDRLFKTALIQAENKRDSILPQLQVADLDLHRMQDLYRRGSVAQSMLQHALAQSRDLSQQLRAARAQVDRAQLNLQYTRIIAPASGTISFRSAYVGGYTHSGAPLFGFIASQKRWVEAKVKERDLPAIHIGDPVQIRFDAAPDNLYVGYVESVGATSESAFAAIPDDFSAGNFSKYPQWFPIRIEVDLGPKNTIPVGASSEIELKRRS